MPLNNDDRKLSFNSNKVVGKFCFQVMKIKVSVWFLPWSFNRVFGVRDDVEERLSLNFARKEIEYPANQIIVRILVRLKTKWHGIFLLQFMKKAKPNRF